MIQARDQAVRAAHCCIRETQRKASVDSASRDPWSRFALSALGQRKREEKSSSARHVTVTVLELVLVSNGRRTAAETLLASILVWLACVDCSRISRFSARTTFISSMLADFDSHAAGTNLQDLDRPPYASHKCESVRMTRSLVSISQARQIGTSESLKSKDCDALCKINEFICGAICGCCQQITVLFIFILGFIPRYSLRREVQTSRSLGEACLPLRP